MIKRRKNGFSMLELLVGLVIFGLGMVPILWLGTTQSRGAYSTGKHMMAGQLAASFLDSMLGLSYKDCLAKAQQTASFGRISVLENEEIIEMIDKVDDASVRNDMEVSFKHFVYKLKYHHDSDNRVIRLDIEVFYRVVEGEPDSEQSVQLSVLKFGDKNA